MECNGALPAMHEYLDGELSGTQHNELRQHLLACRDCSHRYKKLQNAEATIRSLPIEAASSDLAERIMLSLPKPVKRNTWMQWIKRHPAVSVASIFIFVMLSASLSLWNQDKDLVVKGASLDQVVIKGDVVYVPAGHIIDGDLMVRGGRVQVDGEVRGNLVVIDGSYNVASTARIAGKIKVIDQALDWAWYEVNKFVGQF